MNSEDPNPLDEIKKFSSAIKSKLCEKCRGKDSVYINSIPDLVRQMIEHKMTKEGWKKS